MATLGDLLPSTAYAFSYAFPLCFTSLVLTFAGCFLTLHRTRSFAPRNDTLQFPGSFAVQKRKLPRFYLEGGLGGIGIGYSFGLHFATLFALLIPNVTSSAPLSPNTFVAVWVLSCIPAAVLAARFRYAAFLFSGITGGTSLALALGVALHPSLLARKVLLALIIPFTTLFAILPISRTQEASIRLAVSAMGSFGLIVAAAIFSKNESWEDVWARLWEDVNANWGTTSERGLSAGFWLFMILGCLSDWALKRYFGGNPDQKWDSYLAEYATTLPHADDRAGTFLPDTRTFWDKLVHPFGSHTPKTPAALSFQHDLEDFKEPLAKSGVPHTYTHSEKAPFDYEEPPRLLRRQSERPLARLRALARTQPGHGGRKEAVKFRPFGDAGSESDNESGSDCGDDNDGSACRGARAERSVSKTLTNGSELLQTDANLDAGREYTRLLAAKRTAFASSAESEPAPDYSDIEEEDVTTVLKGAQASMHARRSPSWKPPFLARTQSSASGTDATTLAPTPSPLPTPGAVPLTPSLIYAIDRIAVAQSEAYGVRDGMPPPFPTPKLTTPPPMLPPATVRNDSGEHWDSFWRDVTAKVGAGAPIGAKR